MKIGMNNMKIQEINAIYIKAFIALITPLVLYWQDLTIIMNEALKNDLMSYTLIIPFMLFYMIFRMRKALLVSISNQYNNRSFSNFYPIKEIIGLSLCIFAYSLKGFGHYTFHPIEYHIISLPIFISGIILVIFNEKTLRFLLFPITFLFLLVPPPIEFASTIGSFLADFNSGITFSFLSLIGLPVELVTSYGTPIVYLTTLKGIVIPFAIDTACSGIYSLIGFIIFSIFISYISKGQIFKKIVVFVIGLFLILLLNILRINLVILIGYSLGLNIALDIFHLLGGGVLIFLGTIILLVISEKIFKITIFRGNEKLCPFCNNNKNDYCMGCGKIFKIDANAFSTNDVLKLTFMLLLIISFLFIQVPVFVFTESGTEHLPDDSMGIQAYKNLLPEINRYELSFYFRDLEFENISGQDRSLLYRYDRKDWQTVYNDPLRRTIWIEYEVGPTKASLHDWVVCLITWRQQVGLEVTINPIDLKEISLSANPPLIARYFAFNDIESNVSQIILYWYVRMNFKIDDVYQEKWTKISVITYKQNSEDLIDVEEEMILIAKEITQYLEPIEEWTQFTISMGENRESLVLLSILPIFGVIPYAFFNERKKKAQVKHVYNSITDKGDILLLKFMQSNQDIVSSKLELLSKYNEIRNIKIDIEKLNMKIDQANYLGLIETKIINIHGVPHLSWKTLF